MSFRVGSDRDSTAQRGPYVDQLAGFQFSSNRFQLSREPQPHPLVATGSEDAVIDLTSSPPKSPSPSYWSRPSHNSHQENSHQPIFSPGQPHTVHLSDPSGGSTAVSSNAASILDPSPPPDSNQTSVDLEDKDDAEMPRRLPTDGNLKSPQQITPPSSTRPSSFQSPKHSKHGSASKKQTPKKTKVDFSQITAALTDFSKDIRKDHEKLCMYALKSTKPVETRVKTGVDWFADVSLSPTTEEKGTTMKIRCKQHFRGRKADQARDLHYKPACVKTNKDAVPKYRFHHTEIAKNVLSPNSMLKFNPHIRDVAPHEEKQYDLWLKELARMDSSCGFIPLGSREDQQVRAIRKERTFILSLYLDSWLKKLGIEKCNRTTLIRHMASSESDDAITPQQKTTLVNLHSDDNFATEPKALEAARVFTEAFDHVFYIKATSGKLGILLRDVLKLDKTVEEIVESKKTAKVGQTETEKAPSLQQSLEHWIETHTVMGCLICYSNSCEHGDYSLENHKRNFSMDCIGMYGQMFSANRTVSSKDPVQQLDPPLPCKRQCFRNNAIGSSDAKCRPWTENETLLLQGLYAILDHNKVRVKAQCATAEILGRDCWDVHRHLQSLGIVLPPIQTVDQERVKNLSWYDRKKKMLIGDWQDQTYSHDTKVRPSNDPCHHEGICSAENDCPCVLNNILCERFCRCTEECCAYKFTGCGCHASGKTCLQKQKEGRPCICVQLNRECDPDLCGTCGAAERADPANQHNDAMFHTGCQNISIQRGVSKAVIVGQSQLEGCGYGLFTAEDIAQDEFVIEYTGELIVADEGVRREARRGEAFAAEKSTSYVFSLLDYEGIWVDAAIYGNLSRYINHAVENANVQPSIFYVNGEYRIRFSATRNIKAGEELFFNYGENFPNLTKKMMKEKADVEADEAAGGTVTAPTKRGRGRGGRRARTVSEKPATQKLTKAKIAKAVRTGARKEAPKISVDDFEALADLDDMPGPSRKRKRAAKSDDEEEEYHPSLESEDAQEAGKRVPAAQRRARRTRSRGRNAFSDSEAEDSTQASPHPKRGRGRGRVAASENAATETVTASQSFSAKGDTSGPPVKKRRGRPPKNPRPASPVAENDDVQNEIHASFNSSKSGAEAVEGDTISVVNPPRSARGRRVISHGFSPRVDRMDLDDEALDINATPTRSRGRKTADEQSAAVRDTPRTRRLQLRNEGHDNDAL
ncbi:SET domain-containing protein [Colletotrichum karsti]|uniref:SET domain-containing protein n=1 Tax=Colletotrichum karsti TaxID=1095194 RepID=A0A9P6HTF3_9PEZI|nr:SET domain-containing protein [Colletotrichum karsti]KAF9869600.1 SET domain-containing protein [Colletotrichum karsti]